MREKESVPVLLPPSSAHLRVKPAGWSWSKMMQLRLIPPGLCFAFCALILQTWFVTAAVQLDLDVTAHTSGLVEADWTSVYYSDEQPLFISNDGGTSTGGFHVWNLDGASPLKNVSSVWAGRTKLVTTVYDVDGKDYLFTIPQTTSALSAYQLPGASHAEPSRRIVLGDWSALCSWRSLSANNYLFLFGKTQGVQLLVRPRDGSVETVEVQTFDVPVEVGGCAVSESQSQMLLAPDDGNELYRFDLAESTTPPNLSVSAETSDEITGVAVYATAGNESDYVFVALEGAISVYDYEWKRVGILNITGLKDIEIEGLSMYQARTARYPVGALIYALEAAGDFEGFGVSSLEGVLGELGIKANTEYDPRARAGQTEESTIGKECSYNGFLDKTANACDCFAGSTGERCEKNTCTDDCSGHGTCVGPGQCRCGESWGGLYCSFLLVEPESETEAYGVDGDDPAIWVSPVSPEMSRIVTTTKSEEGAGLGVFDLDGKMLQNLLSAQPDNVDIIYGFKAGNRTVDLAFAACRGDNTLCMFEMTTDGELRDIAGGIQPSYAEGETYGSCVYRSKKTGKQYLFVNEKSGRYMQYELTSTSDGALSTKLVRDFVGGSGGQVEGCVTDEDNGWLLLGEEPSALWRFEAEPDGSSEGYRIAHVGDGKLWGDVEGVALVQGSAKDKGFILVSCQGVSAYNVYRRAHPHDYVTTFTVATTSDGQVDGVTNTDGLAAISTNLGPKFPRGLVVVHDDSNELPGGGASDKASYKLIGLENILGAEAVKSLGLMEDVDESWDPRA
ncbi:3-phytase [Geosmithia morbida]|uniref:3-phytase n=1 Tax=Geosmithia morbida TaxID=1094350 RepID=A0A9P4YNB7_9HYPO|nr:3-phytase [Geosmithia morbida]KAF4119745.1 3-phytase [Geosmithia morbida]